MIKADFTENASYNVSDLNGILGGLLSAGVIGGGCNVLLRGTDRVFILSGMAVMPEGQLAVIDADGVTLERKRYVYLDGGVPASSDEPPTGNVLLLAEISGDAVTDRRVRAQSHVKGDVVV